MKTKRNRIWVAVLGLVASSAWANGSADLCADPKLESIPVLAEGRVMPFFAHAKHAKNFMFASETCKALSPARLYCILSLGRRAELAEVCKPAGLTLKIQHQQTRELFGTQEHEVTPDQANQLRETLNSTYHGLTNRGEKDGGFATDLATLMTKLDRLAAIERGADWKVLDLQGAWVGIGELGNSKNLHDLVLTQAERITAADARNLSIETLYERIRPFEVAAMLAILGFIFSIAAVNSKKFRPWAAGALITLWLVYVVGITLRVMISGRAPVTNMYETVMWVGFCVLTLGGLLGARAKSPKIWAAGFGGSALALWMMMLAKGMLDPTIQPLVPVLRDNFWLSTHVTCVTLSYACMALSWFMANYVLIRWALGTRSDSFVDEWNASIRLAIQIGTVFLAAGVILGGVWADYSWGRFWGWDPKETWSLIALIIYMAILHGRYVGWFKGISFTLVGGAGFLFVLMAWFGVNYILATGLHSYGFSTGGALFLYSIFIAQLTLLGIVSAQKWLLPVSKKKRKK